MRIAIVMSRIYTKPGGGAKVIFEYANRFAKDGHDVIIYSLSNGNFYNRPMPMFLKIKAAHLLGKLIGTSRWFELEKSISQITIDNINEIDSFDYIIATAVETAVEVVKLEENKGKKIYFIQGFENWEYSNDAVYQTYNYGMINIVVSSWLKNLVEQNSNSKPYLVSNGIDESIFYDSGLERNLHTIVFQYRSAELKGSKYALDAIELVHRSYPDLKVNMISRDNIDFDLPEYFTIYHNITSNKVAEINNHSAIFICSSIEEGFGLPGLEAMACGCVLVSSNYEAVYDYADDGINCLLAPIRDSYGLARCVIRLFNDPTLYYSIKKNGLLTANQRTQLKSYRKLLQILNNNGIPNENSSIG